MLIVEDGSVVTGANTYASLATLTDYHVARGNTAWAEATAADQEAAVLRAMAFIEGLPWLGRKTAYTNPLRWPRADVVDDEGYDIPSDDVPAGVVQALAEAALRELTSPGVLLPDMERGGQVKREKIDVLETEYADGAPSSTTVTAVMAPLRGLLRNANVITLVRA